MPAPVEFRCKRTVVLITIAVIIVFIVIALLSTGIGILVANQLREGKSNNSCQNSSQCNAGYTCVGGVCKANMGTFCRKNTDCISNSCDTAATVCQ